MRARPNQSPCTRRVHGLAAVELTVVLPVFLLLLLGVGELGRALYQYNALTKAVRDGAIYAGQHAISDSTGVIDLTGTLVSATKNLVVYGSPAAGTTPLLDGLTVGNITVTTTDATHVQVSASYTYSPIFTAIPGFGLGKGDIAPPGTMIATVTARAL